MIVKFRPLAATLFALIFLTAPVSIQAQTPAMTTTSDAILHAPEAARLLPPSVFFRGQSAPVQARNSGGVKFADGIFLLVALVDNSGYSTAVQQRYQAYLLTEVAVEINGHPLSPGAYGVGFVGGHFGVLDIGNHELFTVDATHDPELKRPTPLQVVADPTPGQYRLYEGRDYVVVTRPASSK